MTTPLGTEYRCSHCQSLLAKRDCDGVSIRRGPLQANVTGSSFTVSITCYRCQTLNVVTAPGSASRGA